MTIIKWPGGKSSEYQFIKDIIPEYERYIEPFFGGGAIFFALKPKKSAINDISFDLINFYKTFFYNNENFMIELRNHTDFWNNILAKLDASEEELLSIFESGPLKKIEDFYDQFLSTIVSRHIESYNLETAKYHLIINSTNKLKRIKYNQQKSGILLSRSDLLENIKTGFISGIYMYYREVHNEHITDIGVTTETNYLVYRSVVFFIIREYCYGSMFRYNKKGQFNIPYGGMSYNRKDLFQKASNFVITNKSLLKSDIQIGNEDFETFIENLSPNENDFIFLDPPYDTNFNDYEGVEFTKMDQVRLSNLLLKTRAKFILIIKETEFIRNLYENKKNIRIENFEKKYTYNVRGRNDRDVEHLIISNYDH